MQSAVGNKKLCVRDFNHSKDVAKYIMLHDENGPDMNAKIISEFFSDGDLLITQFIMSLTCTKFRRLKFTQYVNICTRQRDYLTEREKSEAELFCHPNRVQQWLNARRPCTCMQTRWPYFVLHLNMRYLETMMRSSPLKTDLRCYLCSASFAILRSSDVSFHWFHNDRILYYDHNPVQYIDAHSWHGPSSTADLASGCEKENTFDYEIGLRLSNIHVSCSGMYDPEIDVGMSCSRNLVHGGFCGNCIDNRRYFIRFDFSMKFSKISDMFVDYMREPDSLPLIIKFDKLFDNALLNLGPNYDSEYTQNVVNAMLSDHAQCMRHFVSYAYYFKKMNRTKSGTYFYNSLVISFKYWFITTGCKYFYAPGVCRFKKGSNVKLYLPYWHVNDSNIPTMARAIANLNDYYPKHIAFGTVTEHPSHSTIPTPRQNRVIRNHLEDWDCPGDLPLDKFLTDGVMRSASFYRTVDTLNSHGSYCMHKRYCKKDDTNCPISTSIGTDIVDQHMPADTGRVKYRNNMIMRFLFPKFLEDVPSLYVVCPRNWRTLPNCSSFKLGLLPHNRVCIKGPVGYRPLSLLSDIPCVNEEDMCICKHASNFPPPY